MFILSLLSGCFLFNGWSALTAVVAVVVSCFLFYLWLLFLPVVVVVVVVVIIVITVPFLTIRKRLALTENNILFKTSSP